MVCEKEKRHLQMKNILLLIAAAAGLIYWQKGKAAAKISHAVKRITYSGNTPANFKLFVEIEIFNPVNAAINLSSINAKLYFNETAAGTLFFNTPTKILQGYTTIELPVKLNILAIPAIIMSLINKEKPAFTVVSDITADGITVTQTEKISLS